MGNYIVSARKYRPTGFEEVVGQNHITTTLTNAIKQDQLAQALLFCGPRGVGKTTCARIVANMINGFDQKLEHGSSAALNIYELDAASNNSVDDIRNLIDQVRYPPQYGRYKVYIIDEVHMLSNQAFNAFLKTLEEPPSYAVFILATTEKHKVIPTILSRCQIFDFNRIKISDISDRLGHIAEKENIEAEPEALHLIAQKADGALRDALSLFDLIVTYSSGNKITYKDTTQNLHILDYDYYFRITDFLLEENISQTLILFNEILRKGFDGQNFINGLAEHFRNLLISKDPATTELLEVSDNIKTKYLGQSKVAGKGFLLSGLNIANQCDIYFKGSKNQRLHVEITLMKIAHLKSAINLSDLPASSQEPKKKLKSEVIDPEPVKKTIPPKQENPPISIKPSLSFQKTAKIPSISDLKNKAESPQATNIPEDKNVIEDKIERKDSFQPEDLDKTWQKFADNLKEQGKDPEYNLMIQKYELLDDCSIQIHINNKIEDDIFSRFKIDLHKFLKDELKNDAIKIETRVIEQTQSKKIYTNTDKFNHLAEKNPNLKKLKSALGLDTEF